MIKVISPGFLTTIQDKGRFGYQQFGVSVCGAMDFYSMALANVLIDNDVNDACLEITALGPTLEFGDAAVFALCGGMFDMKLNGQAIENGRAYGANKGDILEIGGVKEGFRGYLAISGGFIVPKVLGSRSTYIKGGFGGHEGRKLQSGDELCYGNHIAWLTFMGGRYIDDYILRYSLATRPIRVMLGPQIERFSLAGIKSFLSNEYTLTTESDRMGYRLEGKAIEYSKGCDGNVISDGIVMGAVQVPSGQPIIMMADRQTTGGYAKIATVITADLPLLGQKKAGDIIRFAMTDDVTAVNALKKMRNTYKNMDFHHLFG